MKRSATLHPIFTTTRTQLTRKAALGVTLLSALSFCTGCNQEDSMDAYDATGAVYYDQSQEVNPYHPQEGAAEDRQVASVDPITGQVEITYNAEENASLDNQLTFAVDVDTASYTIARSHLENGMLPPKETVRVEEFINFFDYADDAPEDLSASPFSVHLDAAKAPFAENKTLLRIGLKGYEVPDVERPATNLVFLIDTSGSMGSSIDLVRQSLGLLLDHLNQTDTIAIVTYAGSSGVALQPTPVSQRQVILNSMNRLSTGGGTHGASGILTAYELAEEAFQQGGLNRVVLCTDGDFNIGARGDTLDTLIEEKRESGITLSVLGFGGRYNDHQMERLADLGNGNYSFIDSLREAQRALVDRLTATLMVIAKDVKVQLELNPMIVKTYRLLGYENRAIADEDFRNDSVDAGEIGAGHGVTALVELDLYPEGERPSADELNLSVVGSGEANPDLEPEIEENSETEVEVEVDSEAEVEADPNTQVVTSLEIDPVFFQEGAPLALLRLRNKAPDASAEDSAVEQVHVIHESDIRQDAKRASKQLMFAAAVAEFAEILRESPYVAQTDFDAIIDLAERGMTPGDEWMAEFIDLVEMAKEIYNR